MNKEVIVLLESSRKCYLPARFVLSFLIFWASVLLYAHKVCLSVTIVAMVNQSAFEQANNTLEPDNTCGLPNSVNSTTSEKQGSYLWSPSTQGVILGAYFYGYTFTQTLGGRLSEMAGGKWPLGISMLLASLLTLATPFAADVGVLAIVILRVVMGLVHSIVMPTVYALFAQWSPFEERSTLLSLGHIGHHVGTVISMPVAGYLCEYGFSGGWPSVYYIFGSLGCVWFIFWAFLAHNSPADHPRISKKELEYIRKDHVHMTENQKLPIPRREILCSIPVWAASFCMFSMAWGFLTLLTKLPTYLQVVLHIPIKNNGLINSMVYICSSITLFLSGYASDYLRTKTQFSATNVRKGFQLVAMIGPAVCLSLITQMGCNHYLVIFLLTAAMGFHGFGGGGINSITADMAPHHAATLFGIVNSFGSLSGIFAPMVAGALLENENSGIQQWGSVFYISAGLSVAGGIVFLLFASAEQQPWAIVSTIHKEVNADPTEHSSVNSKQDMDNSSKYSAMS